MLGLKLYMHVTKIYFERVYLSCAIFYAATRNMSNVAEQQMCARTSILVQLLSLPLPMICTGKGDNENKEVGNSHDLISAILGRLLVEQKHNENELLEKILYDDKLQTDLLSNPSYEGLCAYTRSIIEKLVKMDGNNAESMDIRFVLDVGTISRSQHTSLVLNAKEFCNSMLIVSDLEKDKTWKDKWKSCKDYKDFVDLNLQVLRHFL